MTAWEHSSADRLLLAAKVIFKQLVSSNVTGVHACNGFIRSFASNSKTPAVWQWFATFDEDRYPSPALQRRMRRG
jgi:hypothetical protein